MKRESINLVVRNKFIIAPMKIFLKAQFSAFIGGLVDYGTMLFFTELFNVPYPVSIVFGGIVGAAVNFSFNRYWTFDATAAQKRQQIPKFMLTVAGSIFLKSSGTYVLTHFSGLDYKISRIMVDLLVSLGFNYHVQKYWVFKK